MKLGEIEKTEEENKDQLNITSSHQHELENELSRINCIQSLLIISSADE